MYTAGDDDTGSSHQTNAKKDEAMTPTKKDASTLKPGDIVYSTKYALTRGITKEIVNSTQGGRYVYTNGYCGSNQIVYKNWHLTRASAVRRVLDIISAKLRSIEKQKDKLASLRASCLAERDGYILGDH